MSSGDVLKLSNQRLQKVVLAVLRKPSNFSCTKKGLIVLVIRRLGVTSLRCAPRSIFQKNLNQAVGALRRAGKVEQYQVTNVRLRLTAAAAAGS